MLGRGGQRAGSAGARESALEAVRPASATHPCLRFSYGTSMSQALKHLYKDGGVVRFYRGLGPALLQGPLSRFGDTAANAGRPCGGKEGAEVQTLG